jgi:hypothetical protein
MVQRGSGARRVCLDCAAAGRSSTVREQRAALAEAYGHHLVDSAPDPTPARMLVELLAYDRQFGLAFDDAWPQDVEFVLDSLSGYKKVRERRDWAEAFQATRAAWEAAWRRQPNGPGAALSPALLEALSGSPPEGGTG